MKKKISRSAFTLIETLVAVSLLTVAIVAPMTLASQSLSAAYYSRDQITAFYLAQEAIEALRSIRDGNILQIAKGASINIFDSTVIPISTQLDDKPFRIDARKNGSAAIVSCTGPCPVLQTDGTLYGYEEGWTGTRFTRTVRVSFVGTGQDEARVIVTVTWRTGGIQARTFSISTNLYRWVEDVAAVPPS